MADNNTATLSSTFAGNGHVEKFPNKTDSPEGDSTNTEPEPQREITGLRWFLVCVAIFSANLLYGLDTTIAADIQSAVAQTFNNTAQLGWLGIGFTLGSVGSILPLGKAYAIFDTKWLFISCLVMFAAGSALCGAAPSMNAIIVGRVWAGAGGAGMYLGNLNLITITTTPKEQPFYVGLIGLVYGTGCILGPVVGGSLADSSATWRWVSNQAGLNGFTKIPMLTSTANQAFYLNLITFGIMSPIYLFLLPSLPRQHGTTYMQKVKDLDWLGTVLNAGLYVSFVMAFTFGGAVWAWNDGRVIALIVVFGILTVAFSVAQYYCLFTTPEARLFPCEFLRNPQLVLLYICMACGGGALFVTIYYIPLYFQFVHGDGGTQAAVRLQLDIGYYMLWYLISGIFIIIGASLMYTVHADTSAANIYGFSILLGLGMTTTQAGYAVGPTMVTPDRVAEVIQFMNISQGQSQLLGLTIASAIFQSLTFSGLKTGLAGTHFSDTEIQAAIAGARSTVLQQTSPALRAKCIDVIVRSIDDAYVMSIAAGALYVVCACFLKRER